MSRRSESEAQAGFDFEAEPAWEAADPAEESQLAASRIAAPEPPSPSEDAIADDLAIPERVEAPHLFGTDLFGDPVRPTFGGGHLSARFVIPPFSVLDARQGYWRERKRAWLDLGIESELGRGAGIWVESDESGSPIERRDEVRRSGQQLAPGGAGKNSAWKARSAQRVSPGGSMMPAADYSQRQRGDGAGRAVGGALPPNRQGDSKAKFAGGLAAGLVALRAAEKRGETIEYAGQEKTGTSIFDPVLCELSYRWFSPVGGVVFDPFAGGSVRGVVAALLGRKYYGVDLSAGQIAANREQAARICGELQPMWLAGDSTHVEIPERADFIFSCPPYGNLEVYSDDPRDLSAMMHDQFIAAYRVIIARAVAALKPNRFACFVVGDFRDKQGCYRNFVSDTIAAFVDAGCKLYNEAVLLTSVGSLPIRINAQFMNYRKLGKCHQNHLTFLKGDPKLAAEACGEISS